MSGQHERVTVPVHGRAAAALIARKDLDSLAETLATLSDPHTAGRLAVADAGLAEGTGESEADRAVAPEHRGRRPTAGALSTAGTRSGSRRQHAARSRCFPRSWPWLPSCSWSARCWTR